MNELKVKLIEMLKWFHNFCVANNLCYFAIGGTVLGAIRHQGFIPWDDDIDVAMPRKDYEKLITLLKDNKNNKYLLESPLTNKDFFCSYCKLYDTTTTLIENTRYKTKRGVFIDIFPLDGIGNTLDESKKNFKKINKIKLLIRFNIYPLSKKRKFYKNVIYFLARLIPFYNWRKSISKLNKICSSRDFYNYEYVGNLLGAYGYKEIMKREWFGKPTLYIFESIQIYGPENYDAYLNSLYGDYMKLPPIEQRKTGHEFIAIDLNKSYLE